MDGGAVAHLPLDSMAENTVKAVDNDNIRVAEIGGIPVGEPVIASGYRVWADAVP